jgi:hypothetical protein
MCIISISKYICQILPEFRITAMFATSNTQKIYLLDICMFIYVVAKVKCQDLMVRD